MYARKVAARLKPNALGEFVRVMECEVLPWLRTQEGFLNWIILATPDGSEVATISFWDRQENVQAYRWSGYPQVLKVLNDLLESTPYVKTFEVVGSTLQELRQALHEPEDPPGEEPPETRSLGTHA